MHQGFLKFYARTFGDSIMVEASHPTGALEMLFYKTRFKWHALFSVPLKLVYLFGFVQIHFPVHLAFCSGHTRGSTHTWTVSTLWNPLGGTTFYCKAKTPRFLFASRQFVEHFRRLVTLLLLSSRWWIPSDMGFSLWQRSEANLASLYSGAACWARFFSPFLLGKHPNTWFIGYFLWSVDLHFCK